MIKFADGLKIRSKCGWYEHGEHHGERLLKPRRKGWPPKSRPELIIKEKVTTEPKKYQITLKRFMKHSLKKLFKN